MVPLTMRWIPATFVHHETTKARKAFFFLFSCFRDTPLTCVQNSLGVDSGMTYANAWPICGPPRTSIWLTMSRSRVGPCVARADGKDETIHAVRALLPGAEASVRPRSARRSEHTALGRPGGRRRNRWRDIPGSQAVRDRQGREVPAQGLRPDDTRWVTSNKEAKHLLRHGIEHPTSCVKALCPGPMERPVDFSGDGCGRQG